jgi:hypothetical protein
MFRRNAGGSSNGRTADSDSVSLGSNPSPPANETLEIQGTSAKTPPTRATIATSKSPQNSPQSVHEISPLTARAGSSEYGFFPTIGKGILAYFKPAAHYLLGAAIVAISLAAWAWACSQFPETTTTIRGILILLATGGGAPG